MQKIYKAKAFICSWSKLKPLKQKVLKIGVFYHSLNFHLDPAIIYSRNYEMVEVDRDFLESSTPNPQLKQLAQDHDQ